jgi:arylsulfatase A-like enzyme
MPEILKNNGAYAHLTTDHHHYWEDGGATYHTRYSSWEFFRGQEGDPWKGHVADPDIPPTAPTYRSQFPSPSWRQDWVNRQYMPSEEDQPQAKTFQAGLEFMDNNASEDNWFLQIESFDPHEPFFTQQHYKDLYPHRYEGAFLDWPDYGPVNESEGAVEHLIYQYAALVSMCDHWLGKVLDKMDELNLWEDTMLIVNTDHGFMLSEHDMWGKNIMGWYNETAHLPLFIWDPRSRRKNVRNNQLVQMIDIAPTILDFFGIEIPRDMQGVPLRATLASDQFVREAGLFGNFGGQVNLTDGRYVYMRSSAREDNTPLFEYTLMPTHMKHPFSVEELHNIELAPPFSFTKGCQTLKIPAIGGTKQTRNFQKIPPLETKLFDLQTDPEQQNPIQDRELEARMIDLMIKLMKENDAPQEQYLRLGLPVPAI